MTATTTMPKPRASSRLKPALRFAGFASAMLGWRALYRAGCVIVRGPRRVRWLAWIMRGWGAQLARVTGMQLHIEGIPPPAGSLIVCNHLGFMDIPALARATGASFVAKHELAGWPMIGRLIADMETVFVDRADIADLPRVNALIDTALAAGKSVVLFPEGTSSPGETVLPFHAPLLLGAARANRPVHYAAIGYRTRPGETPAHLSVCWWGDMTFDESLRALFHLSHFEAILRFGAAPVRDTDRKSLARKLHAGVIALFEPVVDADTLARDRAILEEQWTQRAQHPTNTSQRTSMS
jgi:1-acyl-sn-glycerol-3-phosphate acyltransferase